MNLRIRILKGGPLLHESVFAVDKEGDSESGVISAIRAMRKANPGVEMWGVDFRLDHADDGKRVA
jgi:hypothetical protein